MHEASSLTAKNRSPCPILFDRVLRLKRVGDHEFLTDRVQAVREPAIRNDYSTSPSAIYRNQELKWRFP